MSRIGLAASALFFFFIGVLVKSTIENETVWAFLTENYGWIIVAALGVLTVVGCSTVIAYAMVKRAARKIGLSGQGTPTDMVSSLTDMVLLRRLPKDETQLIRARETATQVGLWLLRREASRFYISLIIAVGGAVVGTVTIALLYEQNRTLQTQNERLLLQTDAAIIQSISLEATRRATIASTRSGIYDLIRDEHARAGDVTCTRFSDAPCTWPSDSAERLAGRVQLSGELLDRISTYLAEHPPYLVASIPSEPLDFGTPLSAQYQFLRASPERGQMLLLLVGLGIAPSEQRNFSFAQLDGFDLPNAELTGLELRQSSFRGTVLEGANFSRSNLAGTDFTGANLLTASFVDANLTDVVLPDEVFAAQFDGAQLSGTVFPDTFSRTFEEALETELMAISFRDAWAWSDNPPVGLPNDVEIALCQHEPGRRRDFRSQLDICS